MKKNIILSFVAVSFLVQFSCSRKFGGNPDGLEVNISCSIDRNYKDSKLFIGGVNNNTFIKSDSLLIPLIGYGRFSPSLNKDGSGWSPNMSAISKTPSDSCYFWIKLGNERNELLRYDESDIINQGYIRVKRPSSNKFSRNDESINIIITRDMVTAVTN